MSSKFKNNLKMISKSKVSILVVCLILIPLVLNNQHSNNYISAHSPVSSPMEIFSLWNDTIPLIDGFVDFNSSSSASEWTTAAIYDLYDSDQDPSSKLLLKNDDTNLYVGVDVISYTTESPASTWGMGVYLDRDHNGMLSQNDRAISYKSNATDNLVIIYQYSALNNYWVEIETGFLEENLTSSHVIIDTDFKGSFFKEDSHRQYEIIIPLSFMQVAPGEITGIAFEVFENLNGDNEENTWPFVETTLNNIRLNAGLWGDLFIGKNSGDYFTKFSIEDNFNIKDSAIGSNNGTFMTTADINGDGDLELIVSSNRTVTSDNNLLAIYNTIDGELVKIWSSWFTTHQLKMFLVKQIIAYDFDENGQDELYLAGEDSRILRLTEWDEDTNDFDKSDYAFIHTSSLTGYLAIGEATNMGVMNLVFGDQNGEVSVLDYVNATGLFKQDKKAPIKPIVTGYTVEKVHAIEIADVDTDGKYEILMNLQITSDDSVSTTRLQIYERTVAKFLENTNDNLPSASSILTEDNFGHTIIVADVDNDLESEIVLVGQNYLRILSVNSFLDAEPHLEFKINDNENSPFMGGGALLWDVDDDSFNELVFSCNNGSIYVINITDSGSNSLSYNVEWSSDIGSSSGKRKSILAYDLDEDGETEIIFGDNFGQILILGKSTTPEIRILSPSSGSSVSTTSILITWEGLDDFTIHHYDIFVEGSIQGRVNGSQAAFLVSLPSSSNTIKVQCFDINGKSASDSIIVSQSTTAPEIHITTPENYFQTASNNIRIEFNYFDPNGDFNHYEIWVDESQLGGDYNLSTTFVDLTLNTDGEHNITVVGVDLASNRGRSSIFVTVDTTAPLMTITTPISGSAMKLAIIEMQWSASDALSGLSHFVIEKDGQVYATTSTLSQLVALDTDKTYSLRVTAYDQLSNSRIDSITIVKDTAKPSISITDPIDGYKTSSDQITINWDAEDNIGGTGIHHTEVVVDQQTKYSGIGATTTTFSVENEGVKDIIVTTYDLAGNIDSDHIIIFVDNTIPYLEIISPETGFTTGLDYFIANWYSNDTGSGISEYNIYVDNILIEIISNPLVTTTIVPLALDHTSSIIIGVVDLYGYAFNDTITVTQDSTLPSIALVTPQANLSYISDSQISIEWDVSNIQNFISYCIYVNEILNQTISEISTRNTVIDLGDIAIDEYPLFNLTIIIQTLSNNISDTKWIIVDQSEPTVIITTPTNYTTYFQDIVYIQWTANDQGSGVYSYRILINGQYLNFCSCDKNYFYLIFDEEDGEQLITVEVLDLASNRVTSNITLLLNILMPDYEANIPTIYYTQDGDFQFEFTITDTQSGVKGLIILLDNDEIVNENYELSIRNESFTISYDFNVSSFIGFDDSHELEVAVLDYYNRELIQLYIINIDTEAPTILPDITINSVLLTADGLEVLNGSEKILSILITVTDNFGLDGVTMTILGDDSSVTYDMITETEGVQIAIYSLNLSLADFEIGEYTIIFTTFDFAGNNQSLSYNLAIVPEAGNSWLQQGNNALYLSIGISGFVIISILLAAVTRGPIQNKNWREEIIAVLYVKKTGLTCVSVNYVTKLIQEEQLIGGAMVAIQSMLTEISGRKLKGTIETLELGDKTMFLFLGEHGISVLMVNQVKPIHVKLLKKFDNKFVKKYSNALENLYFVDSSSFSGSEELVEKIFGSVKEITPEAGITNQLQNVINDIEPEVTHSTEKDKKDFDLIHKSDSPIDHLVSQLSREANRSLMKIISSTPTIIIALTEQNFDEADFHLQSVIMDLDLIRQLERTNFELQLFIENMRTITNEIRVAIDAGRQNNNFRLKQAIENSTKIWFNEIAEKWSDI